jgi:predicted thioesterase
MQPGLRHTVLTTVGPPDLATAIGSGDVEVLATPRVLALLEAAAVAAVRAELPATETTVGAWVELEHLLPSPLGTPVEATAELEAVNGRRLEFRLAVTDGEGREVARGRHRRVVVDRARFENL